MSPPAYTMHPKMRRRLKRYAAKTAARRCALALGSTLYIEYVGGGHPKGQAVRWQAAETKTGEVWSYGSLEYLRGRAKCHFMSYVVIRQHRNGTKSVTESWPNKKGTL